MIGLSRVTLTLVPTSFTSAVLTLKGQVAVVKP
jgi:hypothetical protein